MMNRVLTQVLSTVNLFTERNCLLQKRDTWDGKVKSMKPCVLDLKSLKDIVS